MSAFGQNKTGADSLPGYGVPKNKESAVPEKDLSEVVGRWLHPHRVRPDTSRQPKTTAINYSFVPAVGYTLQTGFAALVSANASYYNDTLSGRKQSTILTSLTYSQYKQTIIPLQASLWSAGYRYNFITDLRYINYPSNIFGLGGRTDPNKGVTINFSGIKIHQTVLWEAKTNIYIGLGYYFDHFWDINALDRVSRFVNRRIQLELGNKETASGPVLRALYDTRMNPINAHQGMYGSLSYRTNFKALGSDMNSQVLQIDTRTYIPFPASSKNVLALWAFGWMVTGGKTPYLILPSTGWDDNYNTGRGYIQGRFRGNRMLYGEGEYRFNITQNGLVGGVAFANLETFSGELSPTFSQYFPGYGLGLRLKINKHSGTNLCLDYGFGQNNSSGFFVNLGEVF